MKNCINVPNNVAEASKAEDERKVVLFLFEIQLNKIKKIIVMLMIAGLILEIKYLFLELRAPKLKPIKPDKGIQGVSILNWKVAIDFASLLKFGPIKLIKKLALKYINIPNKINIRVSFMLTCVSTTPLSLLLMGVKTATTAL